MSAICIIPARGGSRRIKRKNIKDFLSHPIISYSILCAKACSVFDRVVVTTDDAEIASVAESYGADIYMRDMDFGDNSVGTQAVIKECLKGISYRGQHVCCFYATAPLITSADLSEGYQILKQESHLHYVFTVGAEPLRDAGAWYWGKRMAFGSGKPLVGPHTRLYLLPNERICDINTPKDWERAEQLYKEANLVA